MHYSYKHKIRDLFILCISFFLKTRDARILVFHDIQSSRAAKFEARLIWLKRKFNLVTLQEIVLGTYPEKSIAITFDDGYQSWVEIVCPILAELDIPATFFVNSGIVDLSNKEGSNFFQSRCYRSETYLKPLTLEGIQKIRSNNLFTIGGHTRDHERFSQFTPSTKVLEQIHGEKKYLEQVTGNSIHYFAYPFGQLDNATLNIQKVVKEAGYKNAFTIVPSFISNTRNPYLIGRDSLLLEQPKIIWNAWLKGGYDVLVKMKLNLYKLLGIRFR